MNHTFCVIGNCDACEFLQGILGLGKIESKAANIILKSDEVNLFRGLFRPVNSSTLGYEIMISDGELPIRSTGQGSPVGSI